MYWLTLGQQWKITSIFSREILYFCLWRFAKKVCTFNWNVYFDILLLFTNCLKKFLTTIKWKSFSSVFETENHFWLTYRIKHFTFLSHQKLSVLCHLVNSIMSEDLKICWFEKRADIRNTAILNATLHATVMYLAPNQYSLKSS